MEDGVLVAVPNWEQDLEIGNRSNSKIKGIENGNVRYDLVAVAAYNLQEVYKA